jgi:hypothetical protein
VRGRVAPLREVMDSSTFEGVLSVMAWLRQLRISTLRAGRDDDRRCLPTLLLQLGVFRFSLLQYRDIGISVQPNLKEGGVSLAGFVGMATQLVGAA